MDATILMLFTSDLSPAIVRHRAYYDMKLGHHYSGKPSEISLVPRAIPMYKMDTSFKGWISQYVLHRNLD